MIQEKKIKIFLLLDVQVFSVIPFGVRSVERNDRKKFDYRV
ncbi:Uncharacterized protein dnm_022240 [Desulfonema magnum]|uniref:Uncharacterized protein n=1 Tax=Desulfonema magnum TaxID=45655 RepID=A0A975GMV2_9BACT|nr:Uncharacterized protein dnm_022240 [Desulfonema magnum]